MKKKWLVLAVLSAGMLLGAESIQKDYKGNIFGGGKERIVKDGQPGAPGILILSQTVNTELYDESALVRISYRIKNRTGKSSLQFQYPRLDFSATIDRLVKKDAQATDKTAEQILIKGEYRNFVIQVNGVQAAWKVLERPDMIAYHIPFKNGTSGFNYDENLSGVQTSIQSYHYYYSFYTTDLTLNKNETAEIQISYETPLYFNRITGSAASGLSDYEDPALNYEYSQIEGRFLQQSERIFCYFLHTQYSGQENRTEKLIFNIRSHVSNPDFLKILPSRYRFKNRAYTFRYTRLKPKPFHTVIIKNSSLYSSRSVCELCFETEPAKIEGERFDYYSVKPGEPIRYRYQNNYSPKLKKDDITVREIRIKPVLIENQKLADQQLIRKLEILFSDNPEMKNPVRFVKVLKDRDYQAFFKKNFITVYKGKPVKCRYIHFIVSEVSVSREDPVLIENIEILK